MYLRAHRRYPNPAFVRNAEKLLSFVTETQAKGGSKPALVGGIQGSYPFDGEYGQYAFPNWATKFYADAVMEWLLQQGSMHADARA